MKNTHPSGYQSVGPLFNSQGWSGRGDHNGPLRDEITPNFSKSDFDGVTYEAVFDSSRLRGEMARVYKVMSDGKWHTLNEISTATSWYHEFRKSDPEASISARLRDFRKDKFGGHTVNRRRRGDPKAGIWEYQLL